MGRWVKRSLMLVIVLSGLVLQWRAGVVAGQEAVESPFQTLLQGEAREGNSRTLFLPSVFDNAPWYNPLSTETWGGYMAQPVLQQAIDTLNMKWIRLHGLSWRDIQPEEGRPFNWNSSTIHRMDAMVLHARDLGLEPTIIIQHSPYWATIEPTSCGAIRADKFDAFATFVTALVARYSQPPFNVHSWELGNEPDVDPIWVAADSIFGCWGDIEDEYYGGKHYGEMLKVVTPAIRAADPTARVMIGGLLLDTPLSTDPNVGYPERFFTGILEAGAAPYFDILPYHDHYAYTHSAADYGGNYPGNKWEAWGGQTLGKPAYLRSIMANYGVSKPLWLNESTLRCPTNLLSCQGDRTNFRTTQARFVVREISRSFSAGAERFSWYTMHGPGWQFSGLLDDKYARKPAYFAFQTLNDQMVGSNFPPIPIDYGPGLEVYRFDKPSDPDVDVIFSPDGVYHFAAVPVDKFVAAYNLYGEPRDPGIPVNGNYQLYVGYEPIYVHRYP